MSPTRNGTNKANLNTNQGKTQAHIGAELAPPAVFSRSDNVRYVQLSQISQAGRSWLAWCLVIRIEILTFQSCPAACPLVFFRVEFYVAIPPDAKSKMSQSIRLSLWELSLCCIKMFSQKGSPMQHLAEITREHVMPIRNRLTNMIRLDAAKLNRLGWDWFSAIQMPWNANPSCHWSPPTDSLICRIFFHFAWFTILAG